MHRHVEVVHACCEGAVEDSRVEPRGAGVEDDVGATGLGQFGYRIRRRGIDGGRSGRVCGRGCLVFSHLRCRPAEVDVGERCSRCASRRDAIVTNAEPTPPAPTTTTRTPRKVVGR